MGFSKKVLFVDDDDTFIRTLQSLMSESIQVIAANSIQSADSIIASQDYDAIVLDHALPDGDGTDFLARYQDRILQPVMILTGHPSEVVLQSYHRYEAVKKFLVKPVDTVDLEFQLLCMTDNIQEGNLLHCLLRLHHSHLNAEIYRMILHEISESLTVIDGSVTLLQNENRPENQRLRYLNEASTRAIQLVQIAHRLEQYKDRNVQEFDLHDCICTMIDMYSGILSPFIKFVFYTEFDRMHIETARIYLEIALNNVIRNAVQAIRYEGIISISIRDERDGQLHIYIEDDGPGIPPEVRQNLFAPHISNKDSASGLGLYFTKFLLDKINGTINVVRSNAKGTVFKIVLPASIVK